MESWWVQNGALEGPQNSGSRSHHFEKELDPDPHSSGKPDPDQHLCEKRDPDPH